VENFSANTNTTVGLVLVGPQSFRHCSAYQSASTTTTMEIGRRTTTNKREKLRWLAGVGGVRVVAARLFVVVLSKKKISIF
jgi:hypothetical protein